MSGIFSSPKRPKIPKQESPVTVIDEEEPEEVRARERRRLLTGGRQSTILSGIQSALKRRLGA